MFCSSSKGPGDPETPFSGWAGSEGEAGPAPAQAWPRGPPEGPALGLLPELVPGFLAA